MTAHVPESLPASNQEPIEKIILRSMSEGVITLECSGRIYTVNPAALKTLGFTEENVVGSLFDEVFGNEPFNEDFRSLLTGIMRRAGPSTHQEVRYKRPDGQLVDLSMTACCLDFDVCVPELQSVVVVFRDVTALKALERMKRKAVNHLSHELRTPLAIISASIQNMADGHLPTDKLERNLERIQRNLKRLTDIQSTVEEMLNLPEFRPEPLLLVPAVEGILKSLSEQFSHRRVVLRSRVVPEDTNDLDPKILSMVLAILVKNAVEATPDGGEVLVSVDRVPGGILVEVQDRGMGIPSSDQEFIFDGFHHTQATDEYSSKKPYDFDAGGKGLELLKLKTMAEAGYFEISFTSDRCRHIPENTDRCPGDISSCPHMDALERCRDSGGTTFSVLFRSE
jgi:PAS domain S-box-containing protein